MGIIDRLTKKDAPASAAAPKKAAKTVRAKAVKSTDAEKKPAASAGKMGVLPANLMHIIVKPLVTEKSAVLAAHHQYAFRVAMDANRIQVKQAVKALYGVSSATVNIQRVRGKFVRFGKMSGQRQTWKKAIVTVPAGTTLDVYAGV